MGAAGTTPPPLRTARHPCISRLRSVTTFLFESVKTFTVVV